MPKSALLHLHLMGKSSALYICQALKIILLCHCKSIVDMMDMISNDACVIDSNSNFARKSNYESLYFWLVWTKFVWLSRLYQLSFADWILCECVVFFFAPLILMCKMVFWIMIDRNEFEHINLWIRSDKKSISHECGQHMCYVQMATKKNQQQQHQRQNTKYTNTML